MASTLYWSEILKGNNRDQALLILGSFWHFLWSRSQEEESQWDEFDSSYKRGSPTTFAPNQADFAGVASFSKSTSNTNALIRILYPL